MRGTRSACVLALTAITVGIRPAGAVRVGVGVTGAITVYPDLGACGSLTFGSAVTAVGQLSSAGAVNGPGAAAAAVRGATPVVVAGASSWYGCLPDAYAGATVGWATYQLTASTAGGDFAETLQCVVRSGVVTCT